MAPDLDSRLLRVFVTLARTGSFTRAASENGVTQSAVSHGMKRLEGQAGCALLFKRGKSTHLTPEGQTLLIHANRVMEALDRAAESLSGRYSDSRGKLSVIFSTSMAQLILAPVLREFRDSYPRISVVVHLEDSLTAVRRVEEGTCDLIVAMDEQISKNLKAHALFEDRLQFVFSPKHPWSQRERIGARDMSDEHFLLYQRHSASFRRSEDFFLRMGVMLSSYVEIPNFDIMKQLARLGLGVALMAPWVAEKELTEGSLVTMPLPKFPIRRCWAVIHQAQRTLRQPEQTFIGLCRMACQRFQNPPHKG